MATGIVDNSLGSVLDQEFEQLEGFVDLTPLLGRLLGEAAVDHGHDFVQSLTEKCEYLLEDCTRSLTS